MKFFIITPSLNQLGSLKRCIASVRDQMPVDASFCVHHHIQDGGSTDGTVEYLNTVLSDQPESGCRLTFSSEVDGGMYDALNKGLARSAGDVVAWLNSDEQYLPGALFAAAEFFRSHADAGLLCGDALVINPDGTLTGFWKSMPLRLRYLESGYLYNLSCAMFFRRSALCEMRFDPSLRAAGDQEFVIRVLRSGVRPAQIHRYLAAYTFMSGNLSEQPFAAAERRTLFASKTLQSRFFRILQRGERLLRGCRTQTFPLEYAIYADELGQRTMFRSGPVSSCWPGER